ncbi:PREDICTED: ATP synthase subunit e, mitochondrial [Myotis davidii]|uniref:ATP synthase subunit e, mitochondrial n=1 Tax=Myotis davidii TaxID=225400 RepID=UPI000767B078|nr:PREDICTED: ATP synthase subunit e, mitochondrial [Myotis davidii]
MHALYPLAGVCGLSTSLVLRTARTLPVTPYKDRLGVPQGPDNCQLGGRELRSESRPWAVGPCRPLWAGLPVEGRPAGLARHGGKGEGTAGPGVPSARKGGCAGLAACRASREEGHGQCPPRCPAGYLKPRAEEERRVAAEEKKRQDELKRIERELAEARDDSILK